MFALADCNNFFVSCERLFDPSLAGQAVVVLSRVKVFSGNMELYADISHRDHLLLLPANPNYPPIRVTEEDQFRVWGV